MTDLRERVARALAATQGEIVNDAWRFYLDDADAAIDLIRAEVLEEAAKVADDLVLAHPGRADLTAIQCAAALRALKENSDA